MLRIFEVEVLLFDCFVYRQTVTCRIHFNMHDYYASEVKDVGLS